jgi:hypothetical protein
MTLLSIQTGDNATVGLMENRSGPRDIDEVVIAGRMIFSQQCLNPLGKAGASDYINPPSTIRFVDQMEKGLAGRLLSGMYCYVRARSHAKLRAEAIAKSKNLALSPFLINKSAQP